MVVALADKLIGGGLFVASCVFLVQRHLPSLIAWILVAYIVSHFLGGFSHTVSILIGIAAVYLIAIVTHQSFEGFEDGEGEKQESGKGSSKKSDPDPAPPKTSDPHVDVGTTILHAYRNLSPEQIGGMRRDTKELMALQKELMGSLADMKPAIEQGAQLLQTFSQFFGKDGQQS
jgi:hypothetical protein